METNASEKLSIRRGDIVLVDLSNRVGFEQGGIRPCLVIQNDVGNINAPTTIVAPLTTRTKKVDLPTHMGVDVKYPSMVMFEQITTIDKSRLISILDRISYTEMQEVDQKIKVSLGVSM